MLVGVLLVASGCGSSSSTTQASSGSSSAKSPYKVSLVGDETGGNAAVGKLFMEGAEAYLDHVNATGGINGHKIEVGTPLDSQSTEAGAATAFREADSSQPAEIVNLSGYIAPAMSLLQNGKVVLLGTNAPVDTELGPSLKPWFYDDTGGIAATLGEYFGFLPRLAGGSVAGKKIDTVTFNLPAEEDLTKLILQWVKKSGGIPGLNQVVDLSQVSFASEAAKIAASHPGAVAMVLIGTQPAAFMSALRTAGYNGPVLNFLPGALPSTFSAVGASNYYAFRVATLPSASHPANAAAASAGLGTTAQTDLGQGWLAGAVAVNGLEGCSATCTAQMIEHRLNSTPVTAPGGLGSWGYTPKNHAGVITVGMYHYSPPAKKPVIAGAPLTINSSVVSSVLPTGG